MKEYRTPTASTDRLCYLALAGLLVLTTAWYEAGEGKAVRRAEQMDKPRLEITTTVPHIDCTPLAEALEARREELFWQSVPLSPGCRAALMEACETHGVPICDALGLIEMESGFDPEAVSPEGCVGLMQTNSKYADVFEKNTGHSIYTPEGNIYCGVWYLGTLLKRYDGDVQAALRAYNRGFDDGDREYARKVLLASEKWGCG